MIGTHDVPSFNNLHRRSTSMALLAPFSSFSFRPYSRHRPFGTPVTMDSADTTRHRYDLCVSLIGEDERLGMMRKNLETLMRIYIVAMDGSTEMKRENIVGEKSGRHSPRCYIVAIISKVSSVFVCL